MRVYEFAKKHNVSGKTLVLALQEAGYEVKSHMVVLDEKMQKFLEQKFISGNQKKDVSLGGSVADVSKQQHKSIEKNMAEEIGKQLSLKERLPQNSIAQEKKSRGLAIENKQHSVHFEGRGLTAQGVASKVILVPMTIGELAQKINLPVNDMILTLLKLGIVASKNKVISEDIVKRLLDHYTVESVKPIEVVASTESAVLNTSGESDEKPRFPVVVVVGHVDHGKTTLLDYIRKTRVAAREKGGITQHIGAYEVKVGSEGIVFLDTPGHEAFMKMRQRGMRVADIAVLVVAADDGVMPQTIEAIKHIQSLNVPVVVAITKIDKVDAARIDVVKRELARYNVVCEDWGGDVVCIPVSGKTGTGVDHLLEVLVLQGQMMELKSSCSGMVRGIVLEAKLEKGYGFVATILTQRGIFHLQDFFVCGKTVGKITAIVDSYGNNVMEALPTKPIKIAGFEDLPGVGDVFEVVDKKTYLIQRNARGSCDLKMAPIVTRNEMDVVNIIIKADTNSSKEALLDSVVGLMQRHSKDISVVQAGVGDITEGDVEFAANTGSIIIGLHIKIENNAAVYAKHMNVSVYLYDVIYHLIEFLEEKSKRAAVVERIKTKVGEATVLRVFDIKGVGVIAGVYVNSGRFVKGARVVVLRNKRKVGEGDIVSLQRDKKVVKEVHHGFECGFVVNGFIEWQPDDVVECFLEVEKK